MSSESGPESAEIVDENSGTGSDPFFRGPFEIFLGVPSDLLSTDARCLVILLGGQCNRTMVDFYRATLC